LQEISPSGSPGEGRNDFLGKKILKAREHAKGGRKFLQKRLNNLRTTAPQKFWGKKQLGKGQETGEA